MTRLLILNADDLGYDPAVDRGILRAATEGIVTSTTAMVNMPFVEEALERALKTKLGIGLHVNFARGPRLSREGELDEAHAPSMSTEEAEAETRAQIDRFHFLTARPPTHLDSHKHLHRHPTLFEGVVNAALAHGLPIRAIDAHMREALRQRGVATTDAFLGGDSKEPYWNPGKLLAALDGIGDGVTELMCHPGYTPEVTKTGYAAQREVELAALCDAKVRARAARGDFALGTFADLARRGASSR